MIAEAEFCSFYPQAFAGLGTHLLTLPSSFKKKSLKIISSSKNLHLMSGRKRY
jgi:hypothetical protein